MILTLDSNVLVYAFIPPIHKNEELILPSAVILEVASVVSSLTGKEEFGKDTAIEISDLPKLFFSILILRKEILIML